MNQDIINQLQKATTLGEMLKIINDNFEVNKTKVQPITRGTIISGLQMAVKMTGCRLKQK